MKNNTFEDHWKKQPCWKEGATDKDKALYYYRLGLIYKRGPMAKSPAAMAGYGARPLEVSGGMAIILNQRYGECKSCEWHPYVCQHCEVDQLEDQRIEEEMAP